MARNNKRDEFYHLNRRSGIRLWLLSLEDLCGLPLVQRYEQWLKISEAAGMKGDGGHRFDLPAGVSGAKDFIIKQSDIDRFLKEMDLYAPRPDYRRYAGRRDLTFYDCGVAYYLTHRNEVNSMIKRIKMQLDMDPTDRYTPDNDVHTEFDTSKVTEQMLQIAYLDKTHKKLIHKRHDYDQVVIAIAIKTLGLAAIPVIDNLVFGQYISDYNTDNEQQVREALEALEYQQCSERGEAWSNQRQPFEPWKEE
jgi:hypothetical protein